MQAESLGGFRCGPRTQLHDLKDLKSMRRCVMGPLLGWDPFTLLPKDGQLALKQRRIPNGGITSGGKAYDR